MKKFEKEALQRADERMLTAFNDLLTTVMDLGEHMADRAYGQDGKRHPHLKNVGFDGIRNMLKTYLYHDEEMKYEDAAQWDDSAHDALFTMSSTQRVVLVNMLHRCLCDVANLSWKRTCRTHSANGLQTKGDVDLTLPWMDV